MEPCEVANAIMAAIRAEQFYILPNAGQDMPIVQARLDAIVKIRTPPALPY